MWSKVWSVIQTLRGSFSAVSKPIFAIKYSLESSRRDLQDLHSFAPLRSQNFGKKPSDFLRNWILNFQYFCVGSIWFCYFSVKFRWNFVGISRQISENNENYRDVDEKCGKNAEISRKFRNCWKNSIRILNFSIVSLKITKRTSPKPSRSWRKSISSTLPCRLRNLLANSSQKVKRIS